jgi:integrase
VPLAQQAIYPLAALRALSGKSSLVFPAIRSPSPPRSDNTLNAALRRLGYGKHEATAHGFRASASSLVNESGRWYPDAIERQLGHLEGNEVRAAYARGEYWEERVSMMQRWANELERLRQLPVAGLKGFSGVHPIGERPAQQFAHQLEPTNIASARPAATGSK